jgi:proteasome activator subunit 4
LNHVKLKSKTSTLLQDWGKPGNIHDLKLTWHIPNEAEVEAAQNLVSSVLGQELKALRDFSNDQLDISKDQLRTRLLIVNNILLGCGSILPFWGEEHDHNEPDFELCQLVESRVDLHSVPMRTQPDDTVRRALTIEGKNVRQAVAEVLFEVKARVLKEGGGREDDTKSLHTLVTTLQTALLYGGVAREDYDARNKSYSVVRRALDNRLVGGRRQIRALMVDRALLQHEQRLLERCRVPFTKLHEKVAHHLLDLSVSHYSYVRSRAQDSLSRLFGTFSHSYLVVMPRLLELIQKKEGDMIHEEFKGALYVILGMLIDTYYDVLNYLIMLVIFFRLQESFASNETQLASHGKTVAGTH